MDCRKYVNQIAISEDEFYGYLFWIKPTNWMARLWSLLF
jgi:hypothetical protein